MKRVSIKDVAREAGVSATTVSYVLNRNPDETISAETTQRVLEAVRRLHYVPNLNARSLSSRRSNLIGVLIPQTEPGKEFMFSNPFYGELLSANLYRLEKGSSYADLEKERYCLSAPSLMFFLLFLESPGVEELIQKFRQTVEQADQNGTV